MSGENGVTARTCEWVAAAASATSTESTTALRRAHTSESVRTKVGVGRSRSRRNLLQDGNDEEKKGERSTTNTLGMAKTGESNEKKANASGEDSQARDPRLMFRHVGSHNRLLMKSPIEEKRKQHGSHNDIRSLYEGNSRKEEPSRFGQQQNATWSGSNKLTATESASILAASSLIGGDIFGNFVSSEEFAQADFDTTGHHHRVPRTSALGGKKPIVGPQIVPLLDTAGANDMEDESEASSVFL